MEKEIEMNKLLHFASWLVLLAMILSACAPAATTVAPTQVLATSAPQPTNTAEAKPAATQAGITVAPGGQFPIVSQKITLKVLIWPDPNVSDYVDNAFTKWLEEKTNIHLDITLAPSDQTDADTKLNAIFASGELPDIIIGWRNMTLDRQLALAQQGLIVPINDYIDKYGVETQRVFKEIPLAKDAVSEVDGKIYAVPDVNECYHCTHAQKMWVYKPWLDKLGLKVPETTDEFEQMLIAFKTKDPNGNGKEDEIPLSGVVSWHGSLADFLMNPFVYYQTVSEPSGLAFYLDNGMIKAPFVEDGYKQGLTYLHKLYAEGLIDPQAFTNTEDQAKALGENPDVAILGAMPAGHEGIFDEVGGESGRWLEYIPIPPLKGPTGLRQNPTTKNVTWPGRFLITKANKYPEASFRLEDLLMSFEGTTRSSVGVPGVDWDYVKPDQNLASIGGGKATYILLKTFPSPQNENWNQTLPMYRSAAYREAQADTPDQPYEGMLHRWSKENYAPYDVDKTIPPLVVAPDQATKMADINTTITSLLNEYFAGFVNGQKDIDKDWDAYIKALNDAGLNDLIKMYQDAYNAKYKP
jgi:putative aldouronate transport system substrate-binding protein